MARPPYEITPEIIKQVRTWASRGQTVEEMCLHLGWSPSTFYNKRKEFMEFLEAVEVGRAMGVFNVENMLYHFCVGRPAFTDENKVEHDEIKPSITAVMFYLKNRAKDKWKERREFEDQEDKPEQPVVIDFTNATDEDLDHALSQLRRITSRTSTNSGGEN